MIKFHGKKLSLVEQRLMLQAIRFQFDFQLLWESQTKVVKRAENLLIIILLINQTTSHLISKHSIIKDLIAVFLII